MIPNRRSFNLRAACLLLGLSSPAVFACGGYGTLLTPAHDAFFGDPAQREAAIATLRAAGPQGLALLMSNTDVVAACMRPNPTDEQRRWRDAIDAVAMAKDAYVSGLYWHTDLDAAKALAAAEGKPILSLRMLGRLNEDFSCANSRFFRTALYANQEIADYLRDNFVLHWQSVRPAPRVTIDFGDGRVMERTLTGNSAHYVLTSDGRVVDVFPGLYGPEAFLEMLRAANSGARSVMAGDDSTQAYQARALVALEQRLRSDLAAVGIPQPPTGVVRAVAFQSSAELPDAVAAERVTVGKRAAEITIAEAVAPPLPAAPNAVAASQLTFAKDRAESEVVADASGTGQVRAPAIANADQAGRLTTAKFLAESELTLLTPREDARTLQSPGALALDTLIKSLDDDAWSRIAALRPSQLDERSRNLVLCKVSADSAGCRGIRTPKRAKSVRANWTTAQFERSLAMDTVRNDYAIRRVVLRALSQDPRSPDVDELNAEVYAELFLTPDSDPWLGLLPDDVYVALDNDGIKRR
ncbi:MAG: hypothetical protein KDA32_11570 [Phycisphaerales bacterium]|nr:hypothetical protein [Phycisphaerales bacterium]